MQALEKFFPLQVVSQIDFQDRPVLLDGDVIGEVRVEARMGLWTRLGALGAMGGVVFLVCGLAVLLLASRLQL